MIFNSVSKTYQNDAAGAVPGYRPRILLLLLALLLAACSSAETSSNGKLNVVATTGQLADAVANVSGDAVNLTSLLGPGIDPHLYVPTEGDVTTFSSADVIFYNGLNLEAQMTRILGQMSDRGVIVVEVGATLPADQLISSADDGKNFDPHFWNDPRLFSIGVEAIADTLSAEDPDNAAAYASNAERYLADIADTHAYVTDAINSIPPENRILITAHDAFGYFERTYGIEVDGLQGISTESEASTADVQALADLIVERKIPSLFTETSVSPRTIESVVEAARAQGHDVGIGGELFSDALGEPGTEAETYLGMLRHNARTIATALGGSAD